MNNLEDIKNRLAAATPGPWEEFWNGHIQSKETGDGICQTFGPEDRRNLDADFIAHAPEDIAYLLSLVQRTNPEGAM